MNPRQDSQELPETFKRNIMHMVNTTDSSFLRHIELCDKLVEVKYEFVTSEEIAGYSATLKLYLKSSFRSAKMAFKLPVFTSDPTPTLLPCLIIDNQRVPASLNNTLEMIIYGWMHIFKTIGDLTEWYHLITDNDYYMDDNHIYKMDWNARWGGSIIPRSDRGFTIKSWLDKQSNTVKFTLQIDRNEKVLEFGIQAVNNLISHIKQQLEFRLGFRERYNYQLQRIELLLQDTNIA